MYSAKMVDSYFLVINIKVWRWVFVMVMKIGLREFKVIMKEIKE